MQRLKWGGMIPPTYQYPLILCSSFEKFHKASIDGSTAIESISSNFCMEVNYAYKREDSPTSAQEYFLVDVVSFELLNEFLTEIDQDAEITRRVHNFRPEDMRRS
jgi:hypothetical protein